MEGKREEGERGNGKKKGGGRVGAGEREGGEGEKGGGWTEMDIDIILYIGIISLRPLISLLGQIHE